MSGWVLVRWQVGAASLANCKAHSNSTLCQNRYSPHNREETTARQGHPFEWPDHDHNTRPPYTYIVFMENR